MAASQKIFAGARIRRIRTAKGLSQTAMAEGLGISPSYLNLIERNQRPLTVQLLLKLASVYRINPEELQGENTTSLAELKEVFADPLLSGEMPGMHELAETVETAPNAALALVKLYRAYREQAERLSDLSQMLASEGRATAVTAKRLPVDEIREAIERRPYHFPQIEDEAEAFLKMLDMKEGLASALKNWLRSEQGISVRVLPAATMPNWRRRYDRHSQRLFISERLSPADQLREIAMEAALIRMQVAIDRSVEELKLGTDEARRLARFEMARYAALSLMMPYQPFLTQAGRARYDVAVLASRFSVSFEQAATRLVTLARPGNSAIPFFLMEIDHAGNRLRRIGAEGFPHDRFGGACPKLGHHACFAEPGRVLVEAAEMPDGKLFATIARTVDGPATAYHERPRRTAILLGCELEHGEMLAYRPSLQVSKDVGALPIGPACRLCERTGCLSRAEPPLTRPIGLDEAVTGFSAYDFQ